jgi:hypothetical protein
VKGCKGIFGAEKSEVEGLDHCLDCTDDLTGAHICKKLENCIYFIFAILPQESY